MELLQRQLNSDFSLKFLDYTTSSGKSLCGLAEALLGEKVGGY